MPKDERLNALNDDHPPPGYVARLGVMSFLYVSKAASAPKASQLVAQTVNFGAALRTVMNPAYPSALYSNRVGRALLHRRGGGAEALWNIHRGLCVAPGLTGLLNSSVDARIRVYAYKISAMLCTCFSERTLLLDIDVFVLQRSLVHHLLTRTLEVASLSLPLDVFRHSIYSSSAIPPICTCMVAFRTDAPTRDILVGAARRLLLQSHPNALRQGDQEMLHYELSARKTLTPLLLPEEYYCPRLPSSRQQHSSETLAVWNTPWPWSGYPCKAVHVHDRTPFELAILANRTTPLQTGRRSTSTLWHMIPVPEWINVAVDGDLGRTGQGPEATRRYMAVHN